MLASLPGWRMVDARLFDLFSTVAPPQPPTADTLIVAIDEPSMAEIGLQWPWPRALHARLLRQLRAAGAKTIALDIVFAEPSDPSSDESLAKALGPDVVLASDRAQIDTAQARQDIAVEPIAPFRAAGARSGLVSVVLDADGTLRRMPPFPGTFAEAVIGAPREAAPDSALIQFFGPPRHYPTVSYYQALDPQAFLPPRLLEGKTVLVGFSLHAAPALGGSTDAFPTPFTLYDGLLTAGVEAQATILDNLRHGLFIAPAGRPLEFLLILAVSVSVGVVLRRRVTRRAAAGVLLGTLGLLAATWLSLRFGRIWLPPAAPVLAGLAVLGIRSGQDFAEERRRRRTIARAFSHYLAPEMVDRLARDPEALRLGGERRVLTILFCDLRGFTALAERMKEEPERLIRLINRLLDPLSEAILRSGGTIDKYIGDCVMGFWNAPLDDPRHATHAVQCALRMLSELPRLNAELEAEEGPSARVSIGIGINTGECIVGNMGSARRFDYTAVGDAVNLAARLESLSKIYGVPLLIGPSTKDAIQDVFATLELDRIAVKGRSEPIEVFTVLDREPADGFGPGDCVTLHAAFLEAFRAGRLGDAEMALAGCRAAAPSLGGYYEAMAARIAERRAGRAPFDPHPADQTAGNGAAV